MGKYLWDQFTLKLTPKERGQKPYPRAVVLLDNTNVHIYVKLF